VATLSPEELRAKWEEVVHLMWETAKFPSIIFQLSGGDEVVMMETVVLYVFWRRTIMEREGENRIWKRRKRTTEVSHHVADEGH
jgi:hypothetical protein